MSLLSSWGKEKKNNELVSLTAGKIANLSESELEKIFFEALRGTSNFVSEMLNTNYIFRK